MHVDYSLNADEVLEVIGVEYTKRYFSLYDDDFVSDLEVTHEGEVKALTEKIDSLTMELELLKGNE